MKILLINPCCLEEAGRDLYSAHLIGPLFNLQPNTRMTLGMPLALPTLAAHTPERHQVIIVDEEIEAIDFDQPVDLVGVTAMTFKASRAYEIAREFRRRGVPVVMGGIHASMCPEEAGEHVDSVVIGEAEELWPQLLADAEAGRLQRTYRADGYPDLSTARTPRYDLVKNRQYLYAYLQTTRGCPYNCNFCTVTQTSGRRIRKKSPEQVVAEVDALLAQQPARSYRMRDRVSGARVRFVGMIAFIDDNFAIDREHALAVCAALQSYQQERGIIFFWYTQVNASVGLDEQLLTAMAQANCQHLFIGFENLDPAVLRGMNKGVNTPERYAEIIRNIHRHHLRVVFSTIIGVDGGGRDNGHHLQRFVTEQGVFHVLLNILTPYPGTILAAEMERAGRILTRDPQYYNIRNVVFRPEGCSTDDLLRDYRELCGELFSYREVFRRGQHLYAARERLVLPWPERIGFLLGLAGSALLFGLRRRLRWATVLRLLQAAPSHVLLRGSLPAIERLVSSADYDDFARSETARLANLDAEAAGSNTPPPPAAEPLKSWRSLPGQRGCRCWHSDHTRLAAGGIAVAEPDRGRPVLVLGGTSLTGTDMAGLLQRLSADGYETACLEHPLGGPLAVDIDPRRERPAALRACLDHLRRQPGLYRVDIIAQSYAALDVVRALDGDPGLRSLIGSIVLVNPPGCDERLGYLRHCWRFLADHTLRGATMARRRLATSNEPREREAVQRDLEGIRRWFLSTLRNPVRTLRELHDIVTVRLREPLLRLQQQGYALHLFLQTDDRVIPHRATLEQLSDLLPATSIKLLPGGHNDLFFQPATQDALVSFLGELRQGEPR